MAARNRCEGVAGLSPPSWAIRRLREIDDTADLHYMGEGRWVLGSVKPNAVRRRIAGNIKRRLQREGARSMGQMQLAVLCYQGFGLIAIYEGSPFEAAQQAIHDFRARDWRYRNRAEQTFEAALGESEKPMHNVLTADESDLLEEIRLRERDASGVLFRGRKHFPMH